MTDRRILDEIEPGSYSCDPTIDSECMVAEVMPPDPVVEESVDGPIERQQEVYSGASGAPQTDELCPPGAAAGCGAESVAPVISAAPTVNQTVIQSGAGEQVVEADSEQRPWGRGYDGPPVEPIDGEVQEPDLPEPSAQPDTPTATDATQDPGEGIDVPAELVEVLLTPAVGTSTTQDEPSEPED